uniref:Uncharacterized protein n=2 Tax=Lygus hesperus TaxID=30085 RepID=A0A0A9W288_LYGHE
MRRVPSSHPVTYSFLSGDRQLQWMGPPYESTTCFGTLLSRSHSTILPCTVVHSNRHPPLCPVFTAYRFVIPESFVPRSTSTQCHWVYMEKCCGCIALYCSHSCSSYRRFLRSRVSLLSTDAPPSPVSPPRTILYYVSNRTPSSAPPSLCALLHLLERVCYSQRSMSPLSRATNYSNPSSLKHSVCTGDGFQSVNWHLCITCAAHMLLWKIV